ncbi:hypothetical protein ACH3XW_18695 [Acanthocheilonema viteae]
MKQNRMFKFLNDVSTTSVLVLIIFHMSKEYSFMSFLNRAYRALLFLSIHRLASWLIILVIDRYLSIYVLDPD